MIAIKPVTLKSFPATVIADQAEIPTVAIIPATGASGSVVLGTSAPDSADATKTVFVPLDDATTVAMTPEQYAAWGTDDDYAINCLLSNLGLVRV